MGIITQIRQMIITKRKIEPENKTSNDIDDYIENEKMKHRIEFYKYMERKNFLNPYGEWKNEES